MRRYGGEAGPACRELQRFSAAKTESLFAQADAVTQAGPGPDVVALRGVEDATGDERQRRLEGQALQQAAALGAASLPARFFKPSMASSRATGLRVPGRRLSLAHCFCRCRSQKSNPNE